MTVLLPFRRDPSTPYSSRAEVEAFFDDFYEFNRNKLARETAEKAA